MNHFPKICSLLLGSALGMSCASGALVSNFTFDNTLTNSIAGQNAGTMTGTTNYATGKFGSAIALASGVNALDLNTTNFGGAIGTGDFSISMWVNSNGSTVSGDPAFLSNKNWGSGTNVGINYAITNTNGNLDINTYGGGARRDFDGTAPANGNGVVPSIGANTWSNLILVRSGTTLSLYVNGVPSGGSLTLAAGANYASALNFFLGDDAAAGFYNESGAGDSWTNAPLLIDDLAVYNHALGAGEISALQSAAAIPEPSVALLGGLGVLGLLRRRRN